MLFLFLSLDITNLIMHYKTLRKPWRISCGSTEAVFRRCSVKKVFWEISQNSQKNTCTRTSFLIKLQAPACNLIEKGTLAQVFSCEFWEISKNTLCYRTPLVAAFGSTVSKSHICPIIHLSSWRLVWFVTIV